MISNILQDIENRLKGRTITPDEGKRLHDLVTLVTQPTHEERLVEQNRVLRIGLELIMEQSNDDWSLGVAEKALAEARR